ncbi:uncharacterized protein LOC143805932 isoform X1 [Ranitomeya variabilis]|uniref:uncharacterized protein LOC143805932 isoform X1 n=1 Tax=Ranitomeya variabilis TaxID=490064 RepID=UPI0040563BB6
MEDNVDIILFNKSSKFLFSEESNSRAPWVITGVTASVYALWTMFVFPGFRKVPFKLKVPYLPSGKNQTANVVKLLQGRKGRLVDLGSGDGRLVPLMITRSLAAGTFPISMKGVIWPKQKPYWEQSGEFTCCHRCRASAGRPGGLHRPSPPEERRGITEKSLKSVDCPHDGPLGRPPPEGPLCFLNGGTTLWAWLLFDWPASKEIKSERPQGTSLVHAQLAEKFALHHHYHYQEAYVWNRGAQKKKENCSRLSGTEVIFRLHFFLKNPVNVHL